MKPGSGSAAGRLGVGDGVTHAGLRDFFNLRGDDADFARRDFSEDFKLGPHTADAVHQMFGAGGHELDFLAFLDDAIDDADQDDDAEIGVVPAIDQHGFKRRGCGLPWAGGCA